MKLKKKIGFIGLGCDKNRVDLERMMSSINDCSFVISNNPDDCDIIVINTCAFIQSARDETEQTIDEFSILKEEGKIEKLVVTGCYNELGIKESNLKEKFPQVDAFVQLKDNAKLPKIIAKLYGEEITCQYGTTSRVLTTPQFAYLKIADGCNNFCSYCKIPYIRGRYKSEKLSDLIAEAKNLTDKGVTELILVAQDVTKYGSDLNDGSNLIMLLRELSKIKKLKWIRLLYSYPEYITDDLINEIANNTKICKYIDIPLQHVSNKILKLMNRRSSKEKIVDLIHKLKKKIPDISIRTTFIVGFPGETDIEFKEVCDFIRAENLNNVGFFEFSSEEGTLAHTLKCPVPDRTKAKRLEKLAATQYRAVIKNNKKMLGKELEVVVDEVIDGTAICRSQYQAPFIDSVIYLENVKDLKPNTYYKVCITEFMDYDFKGELKNE